LWQEENLELWYRPQPSGQQWEEKIHWAINFLQEFGYPVFGADNDLKAVNKYFGV
jgi:hypothetical protein